MAFKTIQTSFSAGEISPSLFARVDLAKFKAGAALLRNMFVDYKGGVSNRGGTRFIQTSLTPYASGKPRIYPFTVNVTTTYLLEFGNQYIRFYSNGAPVLETATTITGVTNANPGVVHDVAHGYSTNDWVVINGIVGMTQLNGGTYIVEKVDNDHYSLDDMFGNDVDTTAFGVWTSGGTAQRVYTLSSPYLLADLPLLKFVQSADVLTIDHPSYAPAELTRTSSTSFTLTTESYGTQVAPPTSLTTHLSFNGDVQAPTTGGAVQGYVVTAVSADGKEESVPTLPAFCRHVSLKTGGAIVALAWTASSTAVAYYKVYKVGMFTDRQLTNIDPAPAPTVYGYIGQSLGTTFTDNNIAPDYSQTPPEFQDPFTPGQLSIVTGSGGSGYNAIGTYIWPLVFTGGGGSGAAGYAVVDPVANGICAVVITNPGKGYTSAPTVTDTGPNTATYVATVGNQTGTYPAVPMYFQQRRLHGGTPNFPEAVVASQVGEYLNYNTSAFSEASDAITFSIASLQDNTVKSMVPMNSGLVIFTANGGFLVSGGGPGQAITPSDITALPQAASGANDMPPIVVTSVNPSGFTTGGNILYVQARGFTVRDLQFSFYTQSFTGLDRSVLASHLFVNYQLEEWCYQEEPQRLVHVIRNDGTLLMMTYVPEQEIYAWTHSDTQGLFVSTASVPEGNENAVYYVVQRYINGPGMWMNYIERYISHRDCCPLDAWYVDCGLQTSSTNPAFNISASAPSGNGVVLTLTAA